MKDSNDYKIYTSQCGSYDGNFLEPLGFGFTNKIEDANLVIFGGGADIDPANYGETKGSRTSISPSTEAREREDFKEARRLGIKCFGICRGFQLLCTLAGGKLIQHVTGHGGHHKMVTFDDNTVTVNSIHHQMVNPYGIKDQNFRILGWTPTRLSKAYLGSKDSPILLPFEFREIEAAYFPGIDSMGVQYHPEMMYRNKYTKDDGGAILWVQQVFQKFFNNAL